MPSAPALPMAIPQVVLHQERRPGALLLSATLRRADGSAWRGYAREVALPPATEAAGRLAAEAVTILGLAAAAMAAVAAARTARATLLD